MTEELIYRYNVTPEEFDEILFDPMGCKVVSLRDCHLDLNAGATNKGYIDFKLNSEYAPMEEKVDSIFYKLKRNPPKTTIKTIKMDLTRNQDPIVKGKVGIKKSFTIEFEENYLPLTDTTFYEWDGKGWCLYDPYGTYRAIMPNWIPNDDECEDTIVTNKLVYQHTLTDSQIESLEDELKEVSSEENELIIKAVLEAGYLDIIMDDDDDDEEYEIETIKEMVDWAKDSVTPIVYKITHGIIPAGGKRKKPERYVTAHFDTGHYPLDVTDFYRWTGSKWVLKNSFATNWLPKETSNVPL